MKVYDIVKTLLERKPDLRDSDKALIWEVWKRQGQVLSAPSGVEYLTKRSFIKCKNPETIRRTRQKLQELNPQLRSSEAVRVYKKGIENQKGTFIFRETL